MNEEEEDEEVVYENVPKDVIDGLNEIIGDLLSVIDNNIKRRHLQLALVNLDYHPLPPLNNLSISFRSEDVSYNVVYTNYKIELSDYHSVNEGHGYDHYQAHNFRFEIGGYREYEGDLYSYMTEFKRALKEVKEKNISVSDEE